MSAHFQSRGSFPLYRDILNNFESGSEITGAASRLACIGHVIYDKFCLVFSEGEPLQLNWCAASLTLVYQWSLVL